jgi:hypothetical protein
VSRGPLHFNQQEFELKPFDIRVSGLLDVGLMVQWCTPAKVACQVWLYQQQSPVRLGLEPCGKTNNVFGLSTLIFEKPLAMPRAV